MFLFSRRRSSSWSSASCCLLTLSLSSWVRLAGFLDTNLSFFGWPSENSPWGWDIVPQVSSWIYILFNDTVSNIDEYLGAVGLLFKQLCYITSKKLDSWEMQKTMRPLSEILCSVVYKLCIKVLCESCVWQCYEQDAYRVLGKCCEMTA